MLLRLRKLPEGVHTFTAQCSSESGEEALAATNLLGTDRIIHLPANTHNLGNVSSVRGTPWAAHSIPPLLLRPLLPTPLSTHPLSTYGRHPVLPFLPFAWGISNTLGSNCSLASTLRAHSEQALVEDEREGASWEEGGESKRKYGLEERDGKSNLGECVE